MKVFRRAAWLAASSFCVLASAANAQSTSTGGAMPDEEASASDDANLADIVVTARRQSEKLLDVPQTVNAVTSEDLQKRNILKFEDLNSIVAGLNLQTGGLGYDSTASVRGIALNTLAQTSGTVQGYVNEVPTDLNALFQGLFDIGQIEILRGPQGTLRGRSAPTGAFTVTTRRPDLNEIGGYASVTGTSRSGINVQAALGMPIVSEVFAVRVAGMFDHNRGSNIKSANSNDDPYNKSEAVRVSAQFKPTSNFSASLTYQHQSFRSRAFGPIVFGTGAPAVSFPGAVFPIPGGGFFTIVPMEIPANFNGPVLTSEDRRSVMDSPILLSQKYDTVTAELDWSFAGQNLHYVGGVVWTDNLQRGDYIDQFNILLGESDTGGPTAGRSISHEIRLSSEQPLGGVLDYAIGYFRNTERGNSSFLSDAVFGLPGAYGSPLGASNPVNINRAYMADVYFDQIQSSKEQGLYGTLTAYLGSKTEFSLGGRQIWLEKSLIAPSLTTDTLLAIPSAGPCSGTTSGFFANLGTSYVNAPVSASPYPGTCSVLLTEGNGLTPLFAGSPLVESKFSPFVWNASLSHKFNDNLQAYVTYGTAWRAGPQSLIGAPLCDTCGQFSTLQSEKSKSIEIGLKGALFDRRLTFSIAAYQQKYDNFIARDDTTTPFRQCFFGGFFCQIAYQSFNFNAPVKVKGVDVEVNYRLNEDFNLGAAFSYTHGRYNSATVPCADSNFDGVPDSGAAPSDASAWVTAGGPASGPALCTTNGPVSPTPPWNLILSGEYSHEAFANTRGFLRGTFNYTPRNTNFSIANPGFTPKAYGLLDLYLGLRSDDGAWELSLSGRNILNNKTVLNRSANDAAFFTFPFQIIGASTGYRSISFVRQREFQISFRHAFGSR